MLTSFIATNAQDETYEFSLINPGEVIVADIEGLGPVEAEVTTTSFASVDGTFFQNARRVERTMVFTFKLNPEYTSSDPYGELRRYLYRWFSPTEHVRLYFNNTHMEDVTIEGWVESIEPTIFSPDPQLSVTVICPESNFKGIEEVQFDASQGADMNIINPGTASVGFTFSLLEIQDPASGFIVRQNYGITTNDMAYIGPMYAQGDFMSFKIVAIPGQKAGYYALSSSWISDPYPDPDQMTWIEGSLGYIRNWIMIPKGESVLSFIYPSGYIGNAYTRVVFTPEYVGL